MKRLEFKVLNAQYIEDLWEQVREKIEDSQYKMKQFYDLGASLSNIKERVSIVKIPTTE